MIPTRLIRLQLRFLSCVTAPSAHMLLCLLFVFALAPAAAAQQRPNIILILADDLGSGDLGCYGQTRIETPRLNRMALEGMRFTQFYAAAPVCAPSRCSILTGQHSGHMFVRDNREVQPEGQLALPADTPTIPRLLQRRAYTSAFTGKWGLGAPNSTGAPTRQGFHSFLGYLCQRQAHNHYPTHLWRNEQKITLDGNTAGNLVGAHYTHDLFTDEALRFIRDNGGGARPFFLFVAYAIPHVALQVPDDSLDQYRGKLEDTPYDGKQGYLPHPTPHAAYAAMVSRMDRDVGRILDLLAELEIDKNTLVIFTSDNGPTHGRVGGADSAFFRSAGDLRGLKGSVYEGGVRVPMIARWPGVIAPDTTTDLPVIHYDLMPTFLEIAGVAAADIPAKLDGVSLVPTLKGEPDKQKRHEFLYWEFTGYGGQFAVRLGKYKAVRRNLIKNPDAPFELYDLEADPTEQRDIAADHPEMVERAKDVMRREHVNSKEFPFDALDQ